MGILNFTVIFILFTVVANVNGDRKIADIKGRLLTPEEGCGYSKVQNKRIVGGSPAKNGAWPWMALLGYQFVATNMNETYFDCGGTLITSRHVLTAAHCINRLLRFVRLGEHDIATTNDGQHEDIGIVNFEMAELNEPQIINDIAVLYLERHVKLTDHIRPICLPINDSVRSRSFVGQNPFIAGWGFTEEDGEPSNVLLQAQIPVISNTECKKKYRAIGRSRILFEDHVLCAGFEAGGTDACQKDSGGPLMLPIFENGKFPYYQIGIVSYGIGCGQPMPGIYTNVSYYMEWIQEQIVDLIKYSMD